MVFKRRQKATARTERGGGGESRGYCVQWARQLHSSAKIKTSLKNQNCEPTRTRNLMTCSADCDLLWEK